MIALDTNILVYSHRVDSQWHEPAVLCVRQLAQGTRPWAIPWPCIHEFFAVVTHPRIYLPPTPQNRALDQIQAWLESPSVHLLTESEGYWNVLQDVIRLSKAHGAQVHDARIAALAKHHAVKELWTADRDFSRFPAIKTKNPLISR